MTPECSELEAGRETPGGRLEVEALVSHQIIITGAKFQSSNPLKRKASIFITTQKEIEVSVIIFYSHMLHFALNVHVTLSGQTQSLSQHLQ